MSELSLPEHARIIPTKGIDLGRTTPTLFAEQAREAGRLAARLSIDPLHVYDNNPFIAREWSILALELHALASRLETRFLSLFQGIDQ